MKTILKHSYFITLLIVVGFTSIISYSCIEDSSKNKQEVVDDNPMIWTYDAEKDTMLYNQKPSALTTEQTIESINERYKGVVNLDFVRASKDTVFVRIYDANNLTQRMGSTGAFGYLAEATFSLTELPGINLVHFEFEEGDHASPGLYKRDSFQNKL